MDWFYALEGRQYGPVSWDELQRLARNSQLKPTDHVWNSTMGQSWSKAALAPNLFPVAAPLQGGMPLTPGVPPVQDPMAPPHPGVGPLSAGVPPIQGSTDHAYASWARPASDELRVRAWASLCGNWGIAVASIALVAASTSGLVFSAMVSSLEGVGVFVALILIGPLELGLAILYLTFTRGHRTGFNRMFEGFHNLGPAINAYMLRFLFISLWNFLFVVLGLIAAYSYRMTFYIIADAPTTRPLAAIRQSKQMMDGHKWRLFRLDLSFFGWGVLCVFTFGIGFLWLVPYMKAAEIAFYEDLRAHPGGV